MELRNTTGAATRIPPSTTNKSPFEQDLLKDLTAKVNEIHLRNPIEMSGITRKIAATIITFIQGKEYSHAISSCEAVLFAPEVNNFVKIQMMQLKACALLMRNQKDDIQECKQFVYENAIALASSDPNLITEFQNLAKKAEICRIKNAMSIKRLIN